MSWKVTTLENHVDLISGPAFKSAKFSDNPDDIPLIKGENLSQQKILWEKSRYWPVNEVAGYEKYFLEEGDVVLAMDRPWVPAGLKYAWIQKADPKALLVQRVARLKGINGLSTDFLRYIIGSQKFSQYIKGIMGGTNVPHISGDQIKAFQFQLPSQTEQKRIVSILSPYDDLIENNRRRIQLLEEAARLLYQEWFVRLRFPGHEHTKIVDGVPEGWKSVHLHDVANITMGQSPASSYYNHDGIGLPFHQGVRDYGNRFPTNTTYCSKEFRIAEAGDILFSVRAPVGRINITLDRIVIGRGLASIRSKANHQEFLFYCLKNIFFKDDLMGTGAIYAAITKKELTEYCLLYPSNLIIESFIEYVKPIDQMIISLHMSNRNLINSRDLLLPRLMNGVIPV